MYIFMYRYTHSHMYILVVRSMVFVSGGVTDQDLDLSKLNTET